MGEGIGRLARRGGLAAALLVVLAACSPGDPGVREQDAASSARDATAAGGNPAGAPPEALSSAFLHPAFALDAEEFRNLIESAATASAAALIQEQPSHFLSLAHDLLELPAMTMVRADKERALPQGYTPPELISLERYANSWTLNRDGLSLQGQVIPDLSAMIEAARLDGIIIDISSSYRSYEYQAGLFEYWVEQLGLEEAERVSARPGTSQHQLGTAVDFGSVTVAFADHPAGIWLADHAADFGFSLSYPDGFESRTGYSFEPWHFRWLSRSGTRMEQQFFGGVQQDMLEFWERASPQLRDTLKEAPQPATLQP